MEQSALELALAGRSVDAPRADRLILARTLMESGPALSGEQRTLVHEAASRPDRFVCVVGAAGSGKTTALRVLADAYRESGVPVLGAAPSGRAADELADAAGIHSSTLHRLLLDAQARGGLPGGCVLVVDEAGMAETRVLAPLLELIEQAAGKAILVGDPQQLPAVGAGGLYPALCNRLGAIELTENRRQRDLAERQALAQLRVGDPEPYLAHAARQGRLQLADDPTFAKQRLLEDWWQAAQHDLRGAVMLAHRRDDVRDLNDAARTLLMRSGRLSTAALELGEREFRVGDRVICRRSDRHLHVRNGMRATVINLDKTGLTLRTDSGALRSISPAYAAEQLEHGYALTGHAAQGATFERAFVLLRDQGALQEWGYVVCGRARAETRLYLADHTSEREAHGRDLTGPRTAERAARALTTSASEPLAFDQTNRISDATARAHATRLQRLEQIRARAEHRLAAAEAELQKLGWRNRRRKSADLLAETAIQRTALRLADEKLAQPQPAAKPRLAPHDRDGIELAPYRARQLRLQRKTLERTRSPEREQRVGPELER